MIKFLDTYRAWIITGVVIVLIGGFWVWHTRQGALDDIETQISQAETTRDQYTALLNQSHQLRTEYTDLAHKYIGQHGDIAFVEARFNDVLVDIAKKDNISLVGVNFGTINGSQPPAPALPQQPVATPAPASAPASGNITNLVATGAGDPARSADLPQVSPSLFSRVPATVTLSGQWRQLEIALQDLSKQDVLMSIATPEIKRMQGSSLAMTLNVQLLTPAVTIVPELLVDASAPTNKHAKSARKGPIRHIAPVRHIAPHRAPVGLVAPITAKPITVQKTLPHPTAAHHNPLPTPSPQGLLP